MPLKLIHPKDITKKLKTTYNRAEHLKAYLNNETFQLSIKFKHLSEKEIEQNFMQIRDWIEELKQSSFEIEFQSIAYRSLGEQSIPKILVLDRDEFLKQLSNTREFKKHTALIQKTLEAFPCLEPLLKEKPQFLMENDKVWEQLLVVCDYFITHPMPNLYIRELDIEGVDTKFIEKHKKILDTLLCAILDQEPTRLAQNGFEKRYGLKYDLPTIRFRILDEALYIGGLSDISLPLNEFMGLDIGCDKIFITENKINGLSFPNIKNSMVIFGLGYGVESLKNVKWLESKELLYWGDIDTHGFAILSQIRGYFPHIKSMLMSDEVIEKFKFLAVSETLSKRFLGELDNLTQEEYRVFENLKENVYGEALRIEQERIRFSYVVAPLSRVRLPSHQ